MTTYIVDIEAVDTRYTKQWKEHLPKQLKRSTNNEVEVISGGETVIIFSTLMPGILQLFNYGIWQNYWVLTFALVACGMLVVMTRKIF